MSQSNASVETEDDLNIEADTVNLNGDISADAVVLTGDVRILKDIVIEAPGGLTINGTLSGDYDLTVHTGDMNLRVTGETSLGALTIEEAADVEFGAVTAASLAQLAGTGTTRLTEGVVLNGAAGMNIATADIEVEDDVTSAAGPIALMASGDVEINGPIQSAAGGIRLNADRDGDGAGGLVIASTATASVTSAAGDIMLNGNDVAVGSAGFTATVTASEGGIVITAGRAGVVTVANDDSVFFAAGDVTIGDPNGGEGTPGQVDLTGWLTADNAISVRSLGDVNIDNLHARATNNIGVYADDDIVVNNSLIVSLSGIISLIPDADGDQSGTLVQLNTRLIEGVTLPDLAAGVAAYKMPAAVLAGTAGRVRVTISNEGQCRASGRVDVLLFLSSTSTLGDDAVLLAMKNNVRINHKPGKSTSLKLRFTIPADMTDGDYYLIAQIVPNINVMDLNASNNTAASPDALIVCKPDLTPSSVVSNLAASVLTGTTGQAVVHVDNIGLVPANETVQVRVYATTTGTLEDAVEVGRATVALSLNAGAGQDVAVSLVMPDVFGEYRLLAVVDATNTLAEDNEANNTLLGDQVIVAADRFVDLEAAANGSTLAGPKLAGAKGTVKVVIRNVGNIKAAGKVNVRVYASLNGEIDDDAVEVGSKAVKISLNPDVGKAVGVKVKIPGDMPAGEYNIMAEIVPIAPLNDSNNLNNVVVFDSDVSVTVPDLLPTTVSSNIGAVSLPDKRGRVKVRFVNDGQVRASGRVNVTVYATTTGSVDGAVEIGRANNVSVRLAPGKSKSKSLAVRLPSALGVYQLLAVIDDGSAMAETNEGNNMLLSAGTVSVHAPFVDLVTLGPDIIVGGRLTPGGKARVKVRFQNEGNIRAKGYVNVILYASSDQTLSASDTELIEKSGRKLSLRPGKSKRYNVKFKLPADIGSGDYYLIAVVLPDSRMSYLELVDTNLTNNAAASATTFTVAG